MQPSNFLMKRSFCLLFILIPLLATPSFSQITLKGQILNEQHEPIADASIWVEYTHLHTLSDQNGHFILHDVPSDTTLLLKAKALGYQATHKQLASADTHITFILKSSPLKLNEVVVTGTGTRNILRNNPVAVDIFTKNELNKINPYSFESAMMTLNPAISFAPTVMGANMQINGLNNSYILVLIDGKRMAGDTGGNTDLSRINIDNIKRIEVQKGAASSLYGSEAIGGVINIITEKRKNNFFAKSTTRYAKYNQLRQNFTTEINRRAFNYTASWQHLQTQGWQLNDTEITSKGDTIATDKKAQNKFYSHTIDQRLTFNPDKHFSAYLQNNLSTRKISRPPSAYAFDMKYKSYNFGVGMKYMIARKGVITLDYYTDNFKYYKLYIKPSGSFNIGDQETGRHQKYSETHLKTVYNFHPQNRFTAGIQHQEDYLSSSSDFGGTGAREVSTTSIYVQDEIRLLRKTIQIVPGVRYTYHKTFKNKLTPKLAMMYSPGNFNLRASYAQGYKAPELKKLYSLTESSARSTITIPNTNLKPETSDYLAVGAEYNLSTLSISTSMYYNKLQNLITRRPLDPKPQEYASFRSVQQYQNTSKARIKGINISLSAAPGYGLSISAGYSFTDSHDYDTRTPLEKVSKHVATLQAGWEKKWNNINSFWGITGRWQSRRYNNDGEAKAFNIWDFSSTHQLRQIAGIILEAGMGVENIFGFTDKRPFGVNYATLSPGRTLFISLSAQFNK